MKFYTLILSFFLLGSSAYALEPSSLGAVCSSIYSGDRITCLSAAQNKYVDPYAAAVCLSVYSGDRINCIRAIAGKQYGQDIAQVCREIYSGDRIACLRSSGTEVTQGGGSTWALRRVLGILRLIVQGQSEAARTEIDDLERNL